MKLMRTLALILTLPLVSGCIPRADNKDALRKPGSNKTAVATPVNMRACVGDLDRMSARYTILPDKDFGGGCSANNSVQLINVSIPITNVTAIQCSVARALTAWTQQSVQSAARSAFGERVTKIETMGAYSCRNIIGGRGTGRSEHASANAVDVSAFILSDGRRVSIAGGWNGSGDEQNFLRAVHDAACKRFSTVLSPKYNAAHHDHLHFDMGRTTKDGSTYCR